MHARHRNIGNGYRSGSIGMGLSASGISPDRSLRGHGFYGAEHRGFNRGYARGRAHPKSYQNQPPPPTPPPQCKGGDIFVEAGRLAAEYLVSHGALPPTVLSGKWQNDNFRRQTGEFQGFRSQEARVDVSVPDADKRRYVDGYSSTGSRSYIKGRRSNRFGSSFGRSGSWSDRNKTTEVEADDDSVSGHREEQPLAEDIASSVQRSNSGDFERRCEEAGDSESVMEKYNLQDEAQSKTGSSSAGKELLPDGEISKVSEGSSSLSAGSGELKGGNGSSGENENQANLEDSSIQQCGTVDDASIKSGVDLVALCKFSKVPTRTRTSLTAKGPKHENIKGSSHNSGLPEETQIPGLHDSSVQSIGKADNPECTDNETFNPTNPVGDLGHAHIVETSKCHRSTSFPDSILRDDTANNSGLESADLHRSHSMGKERGEKRAAEDSGLEEGTKRQREWLPSLASDANQRFDITESSEITNTAKEEKIGIYEEKVVDITTHDRLVDKSTHNRIPQGKSYGGSAEEQQLFPGSFKICDLNLEEASDANENNLGDPVILFPAISGSKREPDKVNFDLSITSSSKSLENTTRMSNGKEIEVIDLDNDSPDVIKACGNSERKQDAPYMGFSHQPHTTNDIHGVSDYNEGLMMVEFLDSFGNIPPLNPEINAVSEGINHMPQNDNTLQNEIGLQNPEVTLGNDQVPQADDDSIFMSLGEIPLTFLQAWDQPPARGYEKPF